MVWETSSLQQQYSVPCNVDGRWDFRVISFSVRSREYVIIVHSKQNIASHIVIGNIVYDPVAY